MYNGINRYVDFLLFLLLYLRSDMESNTWADMVGVKADVDIFFR